MTGATEILSLSGTVAINGLDSGSHLHVAHGCIVRTTAEVLRALLPEWEFAREPDALTGYSISNSMRD